MSANISLLGWQVSGLRCPDHEINLCFPNSSTPFPVTLIQMPNGTGKTTTLDLLRAVLSGGAEHWGKSDVLAMKRSKDAATEGKFVVNLLVDNIKVTFELTLNFNNGTAKYRTTIGSGIKIGFHPPRDIARFLNPQFVELFVFDGELATNLTDSRKTRAREAIDLLFQLTVFDDIQNAINTHWEDHVVAIGNRGERALTKRRNRYEKLKDRWQDLNGERRKLLKNISLLEEELNSKNDAYNAAIAKDKDIGAKLENVKDKLTEANNKLESHVKNIVQEMRYPHQISATFGSLLQDLKSNLDTLKLPSSTSREFFEELALAVECICGRELNDDLREKVKQRASLYLADEEVGVLNAIKTDIAKFCGNAPESYYSIHQNHLSDINIAKRSRDDLETEKQSLINQRLSQGDAELDEKKRQLEKVNSAVAEKKQRLKILDSPADGNEDDDTECIKALTKLKEEAQQDVAEATSTVKLKNQTSIAVKILQEAKNKARISLRDLIVRETNESIKTLLISDPVLISNIEDSLVLEGQGGASVGQTLSVGYAFLSTLFNRSNYSLPFIVDSPAGPLDLQVRPQVAKLIPKLCNQFVAFTISSERSKFIEPLAKAANENVQYITVFRDTPKTQAIKLDSNAKKTRNGVIVTDKKFFDNFDLDEEEI